jgi:two-component system sensor histidine kinase KdpD
MIFAQGSITNIGLLFLLPVMLAATRYGLRTGIVTSLACSLAYNFFFIPPLNTFTIQDPQNIITVLVLLGVAIVGSQLAARAGAGVLAQASAAQNRRWRASPAGLPASLPPTNWRRCCAARSGSAWPATRCC